MYLYYPVVPAGVAKKLWVPWRGPFRISSQLSDTVYQLELPQGSKIKGMVSANRLAPMVDRMSWPDTPVNDLQGESSLEIPGDSQVLKHEEIGKPSVVKRIVDEKVVTNAAGRKSREFLAECCSASGQRSQRWIPEKKLTAGDLIYQFRQAKQKRDQQLLLEGTEVWSCVDSERVVDVDLVELEGSSPCGMSEKNGGSRSLSLAQKEKGRSASLVHVASELSASRSVHVQKNQVNVRKTQKRSVRWAVPLATIGGGAGIQRVR